MKKNHLITVVMCLASLLFVSLAQENPTNNVTLLIESLNKDVQLTDSQKVVLTQRYLLMHDIVNSNSSDRNTRVDAYKAFTQSIDSLLTVEQKEKLKSAVQERATQAFQK
ncbi:MAG: hypothetical protein QM751_04670 [Paludibacteraceae bacterium]